MHVGKLYKVGHCVRCDIQLVWKGEVVECPSCKARAVANPNALPFEQLPEGELFVLPGNPTEVLVKVQPFMTDGARITALHTERANFFVVVRDHALVIRARDRRMGGTFSYN